MSRREFSAETLRLLRDCELRRLYPPLYSRVIFLLMGDFIEDFINKYIVPSTSIFPPALPNIPPFYTGCLIHMRPKSSVKGLAKHLLKKEYIYSLLIFVYEFMHNIS